MGLLMKGLSRSLRAMHPRSGEVDAHLAVSSGFSIIGFMHPGR